jgi:hypothetical protein
VTGPSPEKKSSSFENTAWRQRTAIIEMAPVSRDSGDEIGRSREGRAIRAFLLGSGPMRVSLIGGCHADEPVGPLLLRHVAAYLSTLAGDDPLLTRYQWWIIPHINPDGEERNRSWYSDADPTYDLIEYLTKAVRELPGDDVEFGFPASEKQGLEDSEARPENRAAASWWQQAAGPFHLHASLHGMAFGAGPWFLIEREWQSRCAHFKRACEEETRALGYSLHDVERGGEKGFFRLGKGFCTRPDSRAMTKHFLDAGDAATAALFRPSSMETIRSLGGDPLTLVSEMPLFITPGVGEDLGPPDPKALQWRKKIAAWRLQLSRERPPERILACSGSGCLEPMAVRDQLALQWKMITAGLEQVEMES